MQPFLVSLPVFLEHTNREQQVNDFKRRVQLEIKERKDKETARQAAHKKKRSDERIARRSTILKFWGKAEVGPQLSTVGLLSD